MALYLHTGPAGSGKTNRLYKTVIETARIDTDRNVLLIVPEQFNMQTTTELINLHPSHGIMNIDVLSFMRLAYRVFEELGLKQPVILEDTGKGMIVKKVTLDLSNKLSLYRGLVHRQGFIDELKSVIAEFYQYGISPELLDEILMQTQSMPRLRKKLEDVKLIYNGFRDFLKDRFIMNEELLDLLATVAEDSKVLQGATVAFDGFTGFTVSQYRLIDCLMKVASDIHVNVTIDNEMVDRDVDDESMFYLSSTTIRKLSELADRNHMEIILDNEKREPYRYGSSASPLAHLERNIFRFPYEKSNNHDSIEISSCSTIGEELDLVITRIRRLVADEGLRYGEMAVVLGDMAAARIAGSRFEKAGIPFFLDEKKNIIGTKPVEMIRAVIGIAQSDYSYENVFRFLKAQVSDTMGDTSAIENYVTARAVRGRNRWHREWDYNEKNRYTRYHVDIDEINRQRELFTALTDEAVECLKNSKSTVSERIGVLRGLLEKCNVRETLELSVNRDSESPDGKIRLRARENAQLYDAIEGVFSGIDSLLGSEVIDLMEFREILDTGFTEAKLALLPPGNDSVLIGDVERSRITAVKVLFMVGINDNVIPKRQSAGGILSDSDRCILAEKDVTLSPTKRQALPLGEFYMYLAFTKPSQKLFISYHRMNEDKSEGRPAYVIPKVQKLFEGLEVEKVFSESPELLVGADKGESTLAKLMRENKTQGLSDKELTLLMHIREHNRPCFDRLMAGALYRTGASGLTQQTAKKVYTEVLTGSVTSLENYARCAYAHFLRYGLGCEEKKEFSLGRLELGNIYHKAFEIYCNSMHEDGRLWHDTVGEEEKTARITKALDGALESFEELMKDSARSAYMRTKIEAVLKTTIDTMTAQIVQGDFEPESFEKQFNVAGAYMKLKGSIDRIDICRHDGNTYLRVIDYKTGSKDFDLVQLYNGLQIQLVLYMKMARELMSQAEAGDVRPSGMYYYNVNDPIIEADISLSGEQLEEKRREVLKLKGLTSDDKDIIISNDRGFEELDENNVRKETLRSSYKSNVISVGTTKNSQLESSSKVASESELETLENYVDMLIHDESKGILGGEIPVNPFRMGDSKACDYCKYSGICGFEERLGCKYRDIEKIDREEAMSRITQKLENGTQGD